MGVEEQNGGEEMPWGDSTSFVELTTDADADQKTLVLVAERTKRKDPLSHFKQYTGGWNISNKHYWASVGFTAFPMFLIAGIWYVVFGVFLLVIFFCYCCCPRPLHGYSRACYAVTLVFLVIITIAAMLGGAALYTSQFEFNRTIGRTLAYVVHQAESATETLRNVSNYFDAAKQIRVENKLLPPGVQNSITQLQKQINDTANQLATKTSDNLDGIRHVVNAVRLTVIIVTAAMLALSLLGFLFSISGVQCLVFIFVILGWILVAGTFILAGIFLLFHNVAGDTCLAMDEWVQNPIAHTALDDILPCVDAETAQDSLSKAKDVTYQVLSIVNLAVDVSNADPGAGPLVPLLCNPFFASVGQACPPDAVDLKDATQVWKKYVCEDSKNDECVSKGRLSPSLYSAMTMAVNVSYGFYYYSPFLVDLADCDFVRQSFVTISKDHCPGLQSQSKWMYIGLVVVSAAVMISSIFWIAHGREQKHRYYTKLGLSKTF
ncbi:hypothetical protein VitviT2T_004879 [Vitis vinifera]|uniref:Transmembrane protein n=1 Tax=Vitis vinifera TaxID=29760 RepID=A0ABY9BRB9_VITVI|nr:hypothetical protein VitviT2T_004879 [Vitis vinifera]|eukprot:XP_002283090.2 PREDICTED: uncharacterized protein LOC100243982 [Vitis vinifera]